MAASHIRYELTCHILYSVQHMNKLPTYREHKSNTMSELSGAQRKKQFFGCRVLLYQLWQVYKKHTAFSFSSVNYITANNEYDTDGNDQNDHSLKTVKFPQHTPAHLPKLCLPIPGIIFNGIINVQV